MKCNRSNELNIQFRIIVGIINLVKQLAEAKIVWVFRNFPSLQHIYELHHTFGELVTMVKTTYITPRIYAWEAILKNDVLSGY